MIELFPQYLRRFVILSVILIFTLVLLTLLVPGANPIVTGLIGVFGIGIFLVSQATEASNAHTRLINMLYGQLDAEGFLKVYRPLLDRKPHNANVGLIVRLHLSNAYTALGEYNEALRVLENVPMPPAKQAEKHMLARFAITSNICFCQAQALRTDDACRALEELLQLREKLLSLQAEKPEKKRLTFNTVFNEQCCAFLKNGTADAGQLRSIVQNNTSQLERITISLWTARIYVKEQRISEARDLIDRILKIAAHLSYGRQAQSLLDSLAS